MKNTKKLTALILCLVLTLSLCTFSSSAQGSESTATLDTSAFVTNYPYIFVHGMGGWGSYDSYYEESPYWGGGLLPGSENDIIRILGEKGVEAYAASVGPLSSAWDRACELYAQLTGTVVDYGAAHSEEHSHDRFGKSFEGKALMGESWNLNSPVNLVGHSFGGATVRLFASLLYYGAEEEVAATGKDTSELFKGGHDSVHSVITLSAPHNGSQVANFIVDTKAPLFLISLAANFLGAAVGENLGVFTLNLGHFGLTPKENEEKTTFSLKKVMSFYKAQDNCGYDMTLAGAAKLNETIKTVPTAYYYSYTTVATEKNALGIEKPVDTMNSIFNISCSLIALTAGKTVDGIKIEGDWAVNDGIVPLASALYPSTDKDNAKDYEDTLAEGNIESGVWYYTDTMYNMDHFDFCGTEDYPTSFEQFYFDMVATANNR